MTWLPVLATWWTSVMLMLQPLLVEQVPGTRTAVAAAAQHSVVAVGRSSGVVGLQMPWSSSMPDAGAPRYYRRAVDIWAAALPISSAHIIVAALPVVV